MNIVKELRKKMGIQQKELALAIGVAQPTISDWESNKKDPSGDRLKKLADYFGVDELVILGKGVVDLTNTESSVPKTPEARILAAWADSATEEQRTKRPWVRIPPLRFRKALKHQRFRAFSFLFQKKNSAKQREKGKSMVVNSVVKENPPHVERETSF